MVKKVNTICLGIFLSGICLFSSYAQEKSVDDLYPTSTRLFHIERSKNKNIVCYDLNPGLTGNPDDKEPVAVYWINREEHPGQRNTLSYVQRKMAFGYAIVDKNNGIITIEINALKKRKITIEQDTKTGYFCKTEIDLQPAVLQKIYVKTQASNSMQVEYVDVSGCSMATGLPVKERIYQN